MYNSLKEHTNNFHIYIFAFDDLCYNILVALSLKNASIISLKMLENNDLLEAKKTRTRAEYCWTCTSSTIEYVLTNFNVSTCTYVDADLFFYRSPAVLFEELNNGKSVLITEHRYSKISSLYEKKRAGRFCVQFITFTNNPESRNVLTVWKNQCLNWCYNRYEDDKFGDQKYLDEWPVKYKNIQILNHLGGGIAPWNVGQYKIFKDNNFYFGIDKATKKDFELIFFHFHFVRFLKNGYVDLGWNYISRSIKEMIYYPYILKVAETEKMLLELNPSYSTSFYRNKHENFKEMLKSLFKSISRYNLVVWNKQKLIYENID
jgi:hypothetical protein